MFPPNAACINKRAIPSQLANKRGILLCTQPQPWQEPVGEDLFLRYQQQLQLPMSPSISHPMSPCAALLFPPPRGP